MKSPRGKQAPPVEGRDKDRKNPVPSGGRNTSYGSVAQLQAQSQLSKMMMSAAQDRRAPLPVVNDALQKGPYHPVPPPHHGHPLFMGGGAVQPLLLEQSSLHHPMLWPQPQQGGFVPMQLQYVPTRMSSLMLGHPMEARHGQEVLLGSDRMIRRPLEPSTTDPSKKMKPSHYDGSNNPEPTNQNKRNQLHRSSLSSISPVTTTSNYSKSSATTTSSTNARKSSVKQPDKPKKPLSAYNMFFQDERQAMIQKEQEKNPSKRGNFQNMAKEIGEKWKSLDPAVRKGYEDRVQQERLVYNEKVKQYNEQLQQRQQQENEDGTTTAASEDGETKKSSSSRSSKNKRKEDNKPKRPLSAYNLFFRAERERLLEKQQADDEGIAFGEMGRLVGAKWKNLDPKARESYEEMAQKEKAKYFAALEEWKQSKQEREEAARVMVSNLQMGWIRENYSLTNNKNTPNGSFPKQVSIQNGMIHHSSPRPIPRDRFGESPLYAGRNHHHVPQEASNGVHHNQHAMVDPGACANNGGHASPGSGGKPKPKRPLSAYNLFFRKEREQMLEDRNDNKKKKDDFRDMAKILGAKWKSLDATQREVYEGQAIEEKRKYFQAMEEWKQSKANNSQQQALVVEEPPMAIRGGGPAGAMRNDQEQDKERSPQEAASDVADNEGVAGTDQVESEQTQPESETSVNNSKARSKEAEISKCSKCGKRAGRRGCSQSACLTCCTDSECPGHKESREKALLDNAILNGTTEINKRAAAKRASAIPPGAFREPSFSYMGDTAVLWSLRDYMSVPKWRDDAVRRSRKRNEHAHNVRNTVNAGSRKRFKRVMDELYHRSLEQG